MANVVGKSGESETESGQNLIERGQGLINSAISTPVRTRASRPDSGQNKSSFDGNDRDDTNDSDWSVDSDDDLNDLCVRLIGETETVTNLKNNNDKKINIKEIINISSHSARVKNDTDYKYRESIDKINNSVNQNTDCNTAQFTSISNLVSNNNNTKCDDSNTKINSSGVTKSLSNNSIINLDSKTKDAIPETSYSSYNQSLVMSNNLVNSNNSFSVGTGKGRGRLIKLLNSQTKVGFNLVNISNNSFGNSIIRNDNYYNDYNRSEEIINFDNCKNDKELHINTDVINYIEEIDNSGIENKPEINMNADKRKYWKDFYKNRQTKRELSSVKNSNDIKSFEIIDNFNNIQNYCINSDIIEFGNSSKTEAHIDNITMNDTAVSDINDTKTNIHTSNKHDKTNDNIYNNSNDKTEIITENAKDIESHNETNIKLKSKLSKLNKLHELKKSREIDKIGTSKQLEYNNLSNVFDNLKINHKENKINNDKNDIYQRNVLVKSSLLSRKMELINKNIIK